MLNADLIDDLSLAARDHYTSRLPYHNWSHAEAVMESVDELSKRVQHRQRNVARGALHVAAAWHDAGFHRDHALLGFETKEHYSAALADEHLQSNSVDETTRRIVRVAILGTIHGAERKDVNALLLHRADIANLGSGYPTFLQSSIRLWREQQLTTPDASWSSARKGSAAFAVSAADEAEQELPRLGEPIGEPGTYDTNARLNAARILEEPLPFRAYR